MVTTVELRNVADDRQHSVQVDVGVATVGTLLECVQREWQVPRARLVLRGALLSNPTQTLYDAGVQDSGTVLIFVAPVRAPVLTTPSPIDNEAAASDDVEQYSGWAAGGARVLGGDGETIADHSGNTAAHGDLGDAFGLRRRGVVAAAQSRTDDVGSSGGAGAGQAGGDRGGDWGDAAARGTGEFDVHATRKLLVLKPTRWTVTYRVASRG
jgi:hypothetical protein